MGGAGGVGFPVGFAPNYSNWQLLMFVPRLLTMALRTEWVSLQVFVFNKNLLAVLMHSTPQNR